MRVTIPIYVRQYRPENSPAPLFHARPLFVPQPARGGTVLSRVLTRLSGDLRKALDAIGRAARQRELADWTFNPVVERQFLHLLLTLRRRTINADVMAVAFKSDGARLGFFPELPKIWFDVPANISLESRARDVLTEHFLKLEKEDEKFDAAAMLGGNVRSALLTAVDIEVDIRPELPKPQERAMFMLGATQPADGTSELYEVGRSIDGLYPDDLDQAVLREAEVAELARRLADADRRPVLLLGPRGVGKTAIVHETVRRRLTAAKTTEERNKHAVWLLSPQRLISGMSFVGQWEDRLLAILKAAAKRDDVLYFDDVLGLYFAGQHARSSLSVADVMRPAVERREFRMLAEMTPEAFRILRERDRAMADLFDILPLREPADEQTRRILVTVQRQLEDRHRCRFELEAMPAVLDLQRRYVRDVAMPGKAADLLRRLAGARQKQSIARRQALEAFESYSGLSTEFLDSNVRLKRQEVMDALSRRVVSQPAAVEAMADAVCVAKARLNDPGRPVATFLFLGPTGVGKTECAKALAGYLFGQNAARGFANQSGNPSSAGTKGPESGATGASQDNERLLRFDMNEYVDPGAAGRLIGTASEPEGLLTSAVRRQPFGVVLFDEIEKAHPAVFDLLLAVLGEGRLTDARGRLADFTNTIIIMTSNLGVREAGSSFGLRSSGASDSSAHDVYRDAAQRFFRPEFFNRIDRVIPFDRLDREDVANIARRLMDDLLSRDGLTGRRCMLRVAPEALAQIVNAGYHPQLGARALKREVEKQIATPVARKLATMPPGEPTVIDVVLEGGSSEITGRSGGLVGETAGGDSRRDVRLAVRVTPIRPVEPVADRRAMLSDPAWRKSDDRVELLDDLLDRAEAALDRLEQQAETLGPAGGMTQGKMSRDHFAYLAIREQAKYVGTLIERLDRSVEASARPPAKHLRKGGRPPQHVAPPRPALRRVPDIRAAWRLLLAGQALPEAAIVPDVDEHLPRLREISTDLLDELAMLSAMVEGALSNQKTATNAELSHVPSAGHRRLLLLRSESDSGPLDALLQAYRAAFARQHGVSVEIVKDTAASLPRTVRALVIDLPGSDRLFAGESGTHLFITAGGAAGMSPVEVRLVPLSDDADVLMSAAAVVTHSPARENRQAGIVRVYQRHRNQRLALADALLDLRTGLVCDDGCTGDALRRMMLRAMKLPG